MKSCVVLFAVDFLGRSRMKKIWWNTVAGRDSFFDPFFANAFINEIESLNL